MKFAAIAIGAMFASVSMCAAATDDFNRTINSIGAAGSTAYVEFKEGTSVPCVFGIVYLGDTSQPTPKAMLAIVLATRAEGGTLTVSYTADAGGVCTATNVRAF